LEPGSGEGVSAGEGLAPPKREANGPSRGVETERGWLRCSGWGGNGRVAAGPEMSKVGYSGFSGATSGAGNGGSEASVEVREVLTIRL